MVFKQTFKSVIDLINQLKIKQFRPGKKSTEFERSGQIIDVPIAILVATNHVTMLWKINWESKHVTTCMWTRWTCLKSNFCVQFYSSSSWFEIYLTLQNCVLWLLLLLFVTGFGRNSLKQTQIGLCFSFSSWLLVNLEKE